MEDLIHEWNKARREYYEAARRVETLDAGPDHYRDVWFDCSEKEKRMDEAFEKLMAAMEGGVNDARLLDLHSGGVHGVGGHCIPGSVDTARNHGHLVCHHGKQEVRSE